ncbi:MAG: hypothetical protein WCS89_02450 [Candidatus Paceibacterota bacterium]|jgi:hypothetical protein
MRSNAVAMFIEPGTNLIRGVVQVLHPELAPTDAGQNYSNDPISAYYSNDPYEGELMALFLDLFGNWPVPTVREALWQKQRIAANFMIEGTNIGERYEASLKRTTRVLALKYPSSSIVSQNCCTHLQHNSFLY